MSKDGIKETVVDVRRVTKVVKGGRRFSFAVSMIGGDGQGRVKFAQGKAKEVSEAKSKASRSLSKDLIKVPLYQGRTIHHDVYGKSGAAKVILRRAKAGTGVIAGGPMRVIFERLGIHDIVAKSLGTNNINLMIAATFNALSKLSSPKAIAERRGLKLQDLSTKASAPIILE